MLLAQGGMTRDDQLGFFAPTVSGQTGLFETVTADTLHRGDLSLGVYFNNWNLLSGPAADFSFPSARPYRNMSDDLTRLSGSVGYGLSDRWELSVMVPWDRLEGHGGDRAGFVNGGLYHGLFTDRGLGN